MHRRCDSATSGAAGAQGRNFSWTRSTRSDSLNVNAGRGPVADEQALHDALRDRRIGGAIIDAWYVYPTGARRPTLPSRQRFHELDSMVMTPHMSGPSTGTIAYRRQAIADNINRLAAGRPLVGQRRSMCWWFGDRWVAA